MGITVQKCLYDYDCSKCRGGQTNCVAYAQKKWHDVAALNQKHLAELEEYKAKIASGELISVAYGEWVDTNRDEDWFGHFYKCSKCEEGMVGLAKYCPNCGTKMDMK